MLDEAVGVFPGLKWFNNERRRFVSQKITELGFTVLPISELRNCKTPADFKAILAKAQKFQSPYRRALSSAQRSSWPEGC
jgi:hypothetical protein